MHDNSAAFAAKMPVLHFADFYGTPIRVTKHPVHGRMMMANDVVKALGYTIKVGGTRTILNGLKVAHANRILLKGDDFNRSARHVPTFQNATFLPREGLDQLVTGAAAKKVVTFRPWMDDVMTNGIGMKRPVPAVNPYAAVDGTPWE